MSKISQPFLFCFSNCQCLVCQRFQVNLIAWFLDLLTSFDLCRATTEKSLSHFIPASPCPHHTPSSFIFHAFDYVRLLCLIFYFLIASGVVLLLLVLFFGNLIACNVLNKNASVITSMRFPFFYKCL